MKLKRGWGNHGRTLERLRNGGIRYFYRQEFGVGLKNREVHTRWGWSNVEKIRELSKSCQIERWSVPLNFFPFFASQKQESWLILLKQSRTSCWENWLAQKKMHTDPDIWSTFNLEQNTILETRARRRVGGSQGGVRVMRKGLDRKER